MRLASVLAVVLCMAATGCAKPRKPAFAPDAYVQPDFGYRIAYLEDQLLLERAWRLDNFDGDLRAKTTGRYLNVQPLDLNGDGVGDVRRRDPTYDLRFENRQDRGVIWISTLAVERDMWDKKPEAILDGLLESASGPDYETVFTGKTAQRGGSEHRYLAQVIGSEPVVVGGANGINALRARIELTIADQAELDPDAGKVQLCVVLGMTRYSQVVSKAELPVLFLAAYANRPNDFDGGIAAFDGLVSRLTM